MSEAVETNGGTAPEGVEPVKESALKRIRETWEAAGSQVPSASEGERLKQALAGAKAAVVTAQEELEAARKNLSDVCKAIMAKTGARSITFDGKVLLPMYHGDTFFYRERGESKAFKL